MEVLVVPLRNGNNSLVADYEELLLSSQVQLISITQSILRPVFMFQLLSS
ncbi:hypothetical protein NIES4106_55530 (plasmid) [Fischerella sp. NIES-4106]|nr:hypothetical protein NIES4106_55530 [Fischerella sp. NIES-4106]